MNKKTYKMRTDLSSENITRKMT